MLPPPSMRPLEPAQFATAARPGPTMSALPPKADMCGATRDVRFGPKADMPSLMPVGVEINLSSSRAFPDCAVKLGRNEAGLPLHEGGDATRTSPAPRLIAAGRC